MPFLRRVKNAIKRRRRRRWSTPAETTAATPLICPICYASLFGTLDELALEQHVGAMNLCGHLMHIVCIEQVLQAKRQTPGNQEVCPACSLCSTISCDPKCTTHIYPTPSSRPSTTLTKPYLRVFASEGEPEHEDTPHSLPRSSVAAGPSHFPSQPSLAKIWDVPREVAESVEIQSARIAKQTGIQLEVVKSGIEAALNEGGVGDWVWEALACEWVRGEGRKSLDQALEDAGKLVVKGHGDEMFKTEVDKLSGQIEQVQHRLQNFEAIAFPPPTPTHHSRPQHSKQASRSSSSFSPKRRAIFGDQPIFGAKPSTVKIPAQGYKLMPEDGARDEVVGEKEMESVLGGGPCWWWLLKMNECAIVFGPVLVVLFCLMSMYGT